jgi:hypothetical protein
VQGDKSEKETRKTKGMMYIYWPQMHRLSFGATFFAIPFQQHVLQHRFNTTSVAPFSATSFQHHFYIPILQHHLITLQCDNNIKLLCCSNTWFLFTPNHLTTPLATLKFWLHQCSLPPTNYNDKVWVVARFRVFGGVEVGNWGLKCLESRIDFFYE